MITFRIQIAWFLTGTLIVGAAQLINKASAEDLSSCSTQAVAFDGMAALHYATVSGPGDVKLALWTRFPGACSSTDDSQCRGTAYLLGGDKIAVGKNCGAWAYVQYIGEKHISTGWVDSTGIELDAMSPENASITRTSATEDAQYKFTETKGHGIPVCESYLQRLNMTRYADPPICHWDQKMTDSVPGFTPIARSAMSASELFPVIGHAWDFLAGQEVDSKKELRRTYTEKGVLIKDPDFSLSYVTGMLGSAPTDAANWHINAWIYKSPVDIENDGHPRRLIVLEGDLLGKSTCHSGWTPTRSAIGRIQQAPFVIDQDKFDIDAAATRVTFGHPYGVPVGNQFRPVGDTISIFEYHKGYFFSTFLEGPGDFVNARQKNSELYRVLGVFQRSGQQTHQLCEYVVH